MNDADLEMAEFQAAADHDAALRRRGICTHGWFQAGPPAVCLYCKKEFPDAEALHAERDELLR